MRLSVLDQSPVPEGATAADALANTVDLAQRTEAMGYQRYWVAEHHNTTGLAGSAPEVLIAAIAAATERIRVGSGGVMLSHYSPLKVAEAFRVLAALNPGRIDLGIGRAPGSDQITAYALAPTSRPVSVERYPNTVNDLLGYLAGELDPDNPFAGKVQATPKPPRQPDVWVLASSADSASYAAHFGLPLAFAHFITVGDGPAIAAAYREQYQPSVANPEPQIVVAASLLCAETEADARELATSVQAWRSRGLQGPIPPPERIPPPGPLGTIRTGRKAMIVGDAKQAATELKELAAAYGADEAMVVTITWDHEARVRSYDLLADQVLG